MLLKAQACSSRCAAWPDHADDGRPPKRSRRFADVVQLERSFRLALLTAIVGTNKRRMSNIRAELATAILPKRRATSRLTRARARESIFFRGLRRQRAAFMILLEFFFAAFEGSAAFGPF